MSKLKPGRFLIVLFVLFSMLYIYRGVFFGNKIAFPSNLLASFYSPWSTQKFPEYPNGIPNKPIGGNDQVRMFYPWRLFINESVSSGKLPLWNPYNFSGSPLLANFQSAVFYPLNLIYFLFPQATAWSILVIFQPILGTLFMYLFLRQHIKEKLSAFLGAFAFGFSGFILCWSQENSVVGQTAIWLSLILYAIDKYILSKKPKYYLLLIFSLSVCILAGFLQIAFYIFLTSLIYGLIRIKTNGVGNKLLICFLLSYVLSILVCAVQLLPSIEAFSESPRSSASNETVLKNYLLPAGRFITILAPDLFGNPASYNYFGGGFYQELVITIGIIPLSFALVSIFNRRKNPLIIFSFWMAVISFLLAIKWPFTSWFYRQNIPLINTFTPSRILFITSSFLAILSGFGFSQVLKLDNRRSRQILLKIVIVMGVILIGFLGFHILNSTIKDKFTLNILGYFSSTRYSLNTLKVIIRNLVLPMLMLGSLIPLVVWPKKALLVKILVIIFFCLGQFYFLNKYLVIGEKELLYPDHFIFQDIRKYQQQTNRFLSYGLPILSDVGITKRVYSPDGFDPVFPKRYGQLVQAVQNNGIYKEGVETRIEASLSNYTDNYKDLIGNYRLWKLASLLGVNTIYNYAKDYKDPLAIDMIFPAEIFKPLWQKDNWQAYQNREALPRAFLVNEYVVVTDPQKIMDIIFDPQVDLKKTVVLEEKPEGFSQNENEEGDMKEVNIISYQPNEVNIKVNSDKAGLLFLSDNFYPGWKALINGVDSKIYRADFSFRAVVVPKGEHVIIFRFEPKSFKLGFYISAVTIISLVIFVIYYQFQNRA